VTTEEQTAIEQKLSALESLSLQTVNILADSRQVIRILRDRLNVAEPQVKELAEKLAVIEAQNAAKVDITKWLTPDEIANLAAVDGQDLARSRREHADPETA
jgi:hypothetical protein